MAKKQNSAELLTIPKNAIKRVMKLDDDVKQVQHEAVVLVGKATELFLAKLAAKAYAHADEGGRRQLAYKDVVKARVDDPNLVFLKSECTTTIRGQSRCSSPRISPPPPMLSIYCLST